MKLTQLKSKRSPRRRWHITRTKEGIFFISVKLIEEDKLQDHVDDGWENKGGKLGLYIVYKKFHLSNETIEAINYFKNKQS